ncbi:bifunctional heptose 7-phosphate kinase/heptose 1-phosphate adenyltransferase [Anatilimnocola floriformis]|uniref:bifunctional heptose 7-phosphate kinase/heptose 1-phosphate adenyltransferase n=1 Tax=Anatilimnocola floriformis TaxID=2948575 RepID=UPI0020C46FAD|nr:PfkB family carbohydrate kinase [Anatilimnocola floriformis]
MLSAARLDSILSALPRLTIGLVGDLFLDRYLELQPVGETSIETGLVAHQVTRIRNFPGALGTVMNNLSALGVGLMLPTTVIGDDGHGFDLLREVRRLPVDPQNIICDPQRLTPTYTKPMQPVGDKVQELNRFDVRTRAPLSDNVQDLLCQRIEHTWQSSDGLIVLDQVNELGCGVVTDRVRDFLHELSKRNPQKLIYSDSRQRLRDFSFGVLKGNRAEIAGAVGIDPAADLSAFHTAAAQFAAKTKQPVFCTIGELGTLVATVDGKSTIVPAPQVTGPIDICGAGDSATSGIVTALLTGASPVEAAEFGNLIASITIQQLGTTGTATPAQIRDRWRSIQ